MTAPWPELLALLALVLANGAFSTAELAIVSSRKGRLEQRAKAGDRASRIALELAEDQNRFLSTVQIGITLVGVLSGAVGGAALSEPLAEGLRGLPVVGESAEAVAFGAVVVGIAYLTLVVGELVPKRLALASPERFARLLAPPLRMLARASVPLVALLGASTDLVVRLLRVRRPDEPPVTDDDVKQMVRQGMTAGVFDPAEHEMIRGVLRLGDRPAGGLMTPRNEVVWLDLNDSPEAIRDTITASPYSCYPVCDGTLDNVLGVVRVKDLLPRGLAAARPPELKGLLTMPLFLFEGARGPQVLDTFKRTGQHFALVLDEYGSVEGVLTLTDILEAIVGDLPGPDEPPDPKALQRPDGSWLVDGMISPDEFRDLVAGRDLPSGDYHTLAGFLISRLGHIPAVSETLEWGGFRFEVVDMDANRVDKVLVTPLSSNGEPSDPGRPA